jgi:CHAT domain-containing protein
MERGAWDEVRTAAELGLQTMRRLYDAQVTREHKESWLRDAQTFGAAAAYAAVRLGDAPAAARAVERGRGLILSEALRLRAVDAERLAAAGRQDLVDRHAALAAGLSLARAEPTPDDVLPKRPASAQVTDVDAVIDEIRQVTGERDVAAADLRDITAAAGDAALAYITAAGGGGCAVVISGGTFNGVELPLLTRDAVQQRVVSHLQAYDAVLGRAPKAMATWEASLLETTRWLWDAAIGSLLDVTGGTDLTIVSGGLLGLLPLHAAWTPDPGTATGRRHAIDVVAISFAPNAAALRAAQEVAAAAAPDRLVAVADPARTGAPALPGAVLETQAIRSLFNAATVLAGTAATKPAVLEQLADADVLHLSCHGRADLGEPLQSGLLLAGGEVLTVRTIADTRFAPRLAVLSACETAMPGTVLPDEVTGLPTALLQAGAAGVVASLWAVPDLATAMLMVEFHARWATDRDRPARALAEAQRWLRDSTAGEKLAAWNGRAAAGELDAEVAERFADAVRFRDPDSRGEARLSAWAAFTHVGA